MSNGTTSTEITILHSNRGDISAHLAHIQKAGVLTYGHYMKQHSGIIEIQRSKLSSGSHCTLQDGNPRNPNKNLIAAIL